jgi:hypothetical protein
MLRVYLSLKILYKDSAEEISFTKTLKNKFVRGSPISLKIFMTTLLYRSELRGGNKATQLENLNSTGVIRPFGDNGAIAAFKHQRLFGGCSYHNGQQSHNLTYVNLRAWLVNQ